MYDNKTDLLLSLEETLTTLMLNIYKEPLYLHIGDKYIINGKLEELLKNEIIDFGVSIRKFKKNHYPLAEAFYKKIKERKLIPFKVTVNGRTYTPLRLKEEAKAKLNEYLAETDIDEEAILEGIKHYYKISNSPLVFSNLVLDEVIQSIHEIDDDIPL